MDWDFSGFPNITGSLLNIQYGGLHLLIFLKNQNFDFEMAITFLFLVRFRSDMRQTIFIHLCLIECHTVIIWTSPFPFKGMLGGNFPFYSNFNRIFCKQTVETLIRRRFLRRLIWVCTVCLCPTKRTLDL